MIRYCTRTCDPSDQSIKYLLVVDANNVVQRRDVSLGILDGNMRVIRSGLEATDRIIVNGTQRARAGGKVNAVDNTASTKATKEINACFFFFC